LGAHDPDLRDLFERCAAVLAKSQQLQLEALKASRDVAALWSLCDRLCAEANAARRGAQRKQEGPGP